MLYGNLEGLVNGTEQVVFDYEVTGSAVSSISTGNILNGNEDGWYTIIVRHIGGATNASLRLQFNGDTGNNYGYRGIYATSTSIADWAKTGEASIDLTAGATTTGYSGISIAKIYAKTGAVRLVNKVGTSGITTTTVNQIWTSGGVWSNTADNLVSMTILSGTNGLGVGTRIIILKSNNFTNGTPTGVITTPYIKGAWVRVGSSVLGSTASSVTFSGLDGDRDVLYYLTHAVKNNGGAFGVQVRFNSDSGTNYGYQSLDATNTTVSALRDTAETRFIVGYNSTSGYYCQGNMLMFVKKGFIRPALVSRVDSVSGTTVTAMKVYGKSWNNTADNITSLVVSASANNFDTGSQFDLYALRPNG